MQNQSSSQNPIGGVQTYSVNKPYPFTINITENKSLDQEGLKLEVIGKDPLHNNKRNEVYYLPNKDHQSYLDFFAQLSNDFGLRMPQNRLPATKTFFEAPVREVLSRNIDSRILYGYGDPAVIKVGPDEFGKDFYMLVCTSNDAPDSFPLCHSYNLENWELTGFVFPNGKKPEWAADGWSVSDYWAPEVHLLNNLYVVYFAARNKHTLELCIGRASSESPKGPYIADAEPLLRENSIDPHVFIDDDGTPYLLWKGDNNAIWPNKLIKLLYENPNLINDLFSSKTDQLTASFISAIFPWINSLPAMEAFFLQQVLIEAVTSDYTAFQERLKELQDVKAPFLQDEITAIIQVLRTPVYAQQLSVDGKALVGMRRKVIENDQTWEAHLVEGMWLTKRNGYYYLFYSGNDFATDQYGIGVAVCESLFGLYIKKPYPFLKSTSKWSAPGHPSVVDGPDNVPYLFFHGYYPGKAGYKEFRALLTITLNFEGYDVEFF